jgi:mannose-6-phosphate isomerase-like protein (cupin superfamily)
MRTVVIVLALVVVSGALFAQQPAAPPAPKLFVPAADVSAMITKARTDRKPDQANFAQPLLQLAPITANLEYRVTAPQAAAVHEKDAEVFYVVDGAATMVTGGKLKDERRANADNLNGTGIEGGASRRVAKGDFILVPENTPHWFTDIDGSVTLMSLHIPHAASATR